MNRLIELVYGDMHPALGVTEPSAIALATAKACSLTEEPPVSVEVCVNSGIYKNAYTCGIPNTAVVGNDYAAALGCISGDADAGLFVLNQVDEAAVTRAKEMIESGKVSVRVHSVSSELFINAVIKTNHDVCEAEIRHTHTNICYLRRNSEVLVDKRDEIYTNAPDESIEIRNYLLADFFKIANESNLEDLKFIEEAYSCNKRLMKAGFDSERCTFARAMADGNDHGDPESLAVLYAAAAAEARVIGLNYPAMSITGSGNHGIICTLPLLAVAEFDKKNNEDLYRATILSYLITMYIKQYSGRLSAFCGCAIAAGTGMACALTMLRGGDLHAIEATLLNMANSITGMICQGGNRGCVMKVISAVKTAFSASQMAMNGAVVESVHGIGEISPEDTMRNIGRIADPGMKETEHTIMDILKEKQQKKHGQIM